MRFLANATFSRTLCIVNNTNSRFNCYRNVSLVVKEKYIGPVGMALNLHFSFFDFCQGRNYICNAFRKIASRRAFS